LLVFFVDFFVQGRFAFWMLLSLLLLMGFTHTVTNTKGKSAVVDFDHVALRVGFFIFIFLRTAGQSG
jgi:hypothetical protein